MYMYNIAYRLGMASGVGNHGLIDQGSSLSALHIQPSILLDLCYPSIWGIYMALKQDAERPDITLYMYFRSGSTRSMSSILFSYMVNTIPPLMISLASLGNAPLQNVRTPSCLKIMLAHLNEFP
jgi:hypothetical protein